MPYRQLSKSDLQRKVSLTNAKNMNDASGPNIDVLSSTTVIRLNAIQPDFAAKVTLRETAKYNQTIATSDLEEKRNAARTAISQFIKSFNNGVSVGIFPPQARALYGLNVSSPAVPDLKSDDKIQIWGDNIIAGDPLRVAAGGAEMAVPTIVQFTAIFNAYVSAKYAQRILKEAYDNAQEVVSDMRPDVDNLILRIWNEVETYYSEEDIESKRRHARQWGVVYENMPDEISMEGQVTDVSGVVLSGVNLLLIESNVSVVTNSDGEYAFNEQVPGVYNIEVSKDGYNTQTIPVTIIKDKVKTINVQLVSSGGSLFVTVYSEGIVLPDATVQIESLGLSGQTGPSGTLMFNTIPAGDYDVEFTAPGKHPQTHPVTIESGVMCTMSVDLLNE